MQRTDFVVKPELNPSAGPYDQLYRSTDLLWPRRPGRMVALATSLVPAGRAFDVGCGDGKNLVYLERLGWTVDGLDISAVAVAAARRRLIQESVEPRGTLWIADSAHTTFIHSSYDLVVCYGLYHCLNDDDLRRTHSAITAALRPGGLFAFAVLNDDLPVPAHHCTMELFLRHPNHLPSLLWSWRCLALEFGQIKETHSPLVGTHSHALTWGLFQKPVP